MDDRPPADLEVVPRLSPRRDICLATRRLLPAHRPSERLSLSVCLSSLSLLAFRSLPLDAAAAHAFADYLPGDAAYGEVSLAAPTVLALATIPQSESLAAQHSHVSCIAPTPLPGAHHGHHPSVHGCRPHPARALNSCARRLGDCGRYPPRFEADRYRGMRGGQAGLPPCLCSPLAAVGRQRVLCECVAASHAMPHAVFRGGAQPLLFGWSPALPAPSGSRSNPAASPACP
jgi:hypothetical protein